MWEPWWSWDLELDTHSECSEFDHQSDLYVNVSSLKIDLISTKELCEEYHAPLYFIAHIKL
jgi:hypothetical protein